MESGHILPEHDIRPYSVPQLAERWGCSDSMIRKLINQGELQSFRIGTLIRIAAAEVARFEAQPAPTDMRDNDAQPMTEGLAAVQSTNRRKIARAPRRKKPLLRPGSA